MNPVGHFLFTSSDLKVNTHFINIFVQFSIPKFTNVYKMCLQSDGHMQTPI